MLDKPAAVYTQSYQPSSDQPVPVHRQLNLTLSATPPCSTGMSTGPLPGCKVLQLAPPRPPAAAVPAHYSSPRQHPT